MSKADEPAFPINDDNCSLRQRTDSPLFMQGLSKLELFSAMAMQGLCANPVTLSRSLTDGTCVTNSFVADLSVSLAHALIAELEKANVPT